VPTRMAPLGEADEQQRQWNEGEQLEHGQTD
jgi:hypothetical protein